MAKDTITFESEYLQEYAKILENAQGLIDEAQTIIIRGFGLGPRPFNGYYTIDKQSKIAAVGLRAQLDKNNNGLKEMSSALSNGAGQFADLETRAQKEETSLYNELKKKWAFEGVTRWRKPGPPDGFIPWPPKLPPIDKLPIIPLPPPRPPIRPRPKPWPWPLPPEDIPEDVIDDIVSTDPESGDTPRRRRIRHLMRLISSVLNRMLGRRGGGSAGPGEGISPDDPVVGINEPVYMDHRHRGPGDRRDSFSELLELIRAFFGGDGSMGSVGGTGGFPGGSSSITNDSAFGNNFGGGVNEGFGSGGDGSQSMNPFMQLLFALIFSMFKSFPLQDGGGNMDQMI